MNKQIWSCQVKNVFKFERIISIFLSKKIIVYINYEHTYEYYNIMRFEVIDCYLHVISSYCTSIQGALLPFDHPAQT